MGRMESMVTQPSGSLLPRAPIPAIERPAIGLLVILAGVSFVAHMLVAGNYGYFRDELYYIADGWHLQAGYVDQPLLMGWLAALMRVIAGDSLVAIHIIPALASALIIVVTGLMAYELGGGRMAQLVAGVAALFTLDFMATGSIFSMDVLDQLWWALASLILVRLLRQNRPRLWLLVGLVIAIGLLTKVTMLFFCLALALALLVTPERRYLRTRWPWLAAVIAGLGLLPYVIWNALNGWPTIEFWRHYGGVGTGPLPFFTAQIGQLNPIAFPLAAAGLVFYFRMTGARYRLLGWAFVFVYLVLTLIGTKPYILAPAYPILFAAGAAEFERLRLPRWLAWLRPAYVAVLALVGILLAPAVMPILPPATAVRSYGAFAQLLGDRFGWDSLTEIVQQIYTALPLAQRAQACILTENYGEAGAFSQLAAPGRLPPVISGHNNYYLWGPGTCTGDVLILVGYTLSTAQIESLHAYYANITLAATQRCQYCMASENNLPIYILSSPTSPVFPQLWDSLKHYD
ncbi:MAG TPA: glycosyltransferase family 39 protein [Anaerolineae bacterium]